MISTNDEIEGRVVDLVRIFLLRFSVSDLTVSIDRPEERSEETL